MCVSGALFLSSLEIRELQTRVFLAHGIPDFKNAVSTVMAFKSTGSIAAVAAKCSLEIGIPVAVARAVKYITHIHAAISVEDGSSGVAQMMVSAGAAACFWCCQAGCVTVHSQDHAALSADDFCVRIGCSTVE